MLSARDMTRYRLAVSGRFNDTRSLGSSFGRPASRWLPYAVLSKHERWRICKARTSNAKGTMVKRGKRNRPGAPRANRPASVPKDAAKKAFPLHEHIGRQLKAMFDDVAREPVPQKLLELLEKLERKQTKS